MKQMSGEKANYFNQRLNFACYLLPEKSETYSNFSYVRVQMLNNFSFYGMYFFFESQ